MNLLIDPCKDRELPGRLEAKHESQGGNSWSGEVNEQGDRTYTIFLPLLDGWGYKYQAERRKPRLNSSI